MNTKAYGRKSSIDDFYTKDKIVDLCLEHFQSFYQFSDYHLIIEPSAGNGGF